MSNPTMNTAVQTQTAGAAAKTAQRLLSIDFVRGLTLMMMATVNNPGSWDHIYAPLEHAEWNGFTPTDFVFPNFLFISGTAVALALSRKRGRGEEYGSIMLNALRRAAILFFIGVFITAFVIKFDFANLRIPGVLQRIGVVYFICCAMFLKMSNKAMAITAFACLAVYYVLMNFVPVPGFGHPDLMNPEANIGAWLDRLIFTPAHLFRFTKTWDPEGLLTTIPSVATGLFGVLTGVLLKSDQAPAAKLKKLLGYGAAFVIAGLLLNPLFHINKNLWTSSYVLFTSGLSMIVIGAAHWIIDVKGWRRFTAWPVLFGVNSIFAYVFSELFPECFRKIPLGSSGDLFHTAYDKFYVPAFSDPRNASLAAALTLVVVFMTPVLWFMKKKNIILKV